MRIPLSGYIFTWVGYEKRKTYCSKFSAIQWGDSGYWYRVFQVWKCWKKSKTSIACGQCQDATNSIHNVQRYVNKFFVYVKFLEVLKVLHTNIIHFYFFFIDLEHAFFISWIFFLYLNILTWMSRQSLIVSTIFYNHDQIYFISIFYAPFLTFVSLNM